MNWIRSIGNSSLADIIEVEFLQKPTTLLSSYRCQTVDVFGNNGIGILSTIPVN